MKAFLMGAFGGRRPQPASPKSGATVQREGPGAIEDRAKKATGGHAENKVLTVVARTQLNFQDIGEVYHFLEKSTEDCSMVTELDLSELDTGYYERKAVEQLLGLLKDKLQGVTQVRLGNVSVELKFPEELSGIKELSLKDLKSKANIRLQEGMSGVRSIKIGDMIYGSRITFPEDMGALEALDFGRVCTQVVIPEGMDKLRVLGCTSILEGGKLSLMSPLPSLESIEFEGILDGQGIEFPERKEDGLPKLSEFKAREVRNSQQLRDYIQAMLAG